MSVNESIGSAASRPVNAHGGQVHPQAPLLSTAELDAKRGRMAAALVRAALFGDIVTLMAATPAYDDHPLRDLEWLVRPPIDLNQFRIYRDPRGRLVAFAAWAFMSQAVEQRSFETLFSLTPTDWRRGDRPWMIIKAAPYGDDQRIDEDLSVGKLAGGRFRIHPKAGVLVAPEHNWGPGMTDSSSSRAFFRGNHARE